MTDDDLDRALCALPLEEPPADLRGRILAATIMRAPAIFQPWEIVVLVLALAGGGFCAYQLLGTMPHSGSHATDAIVGWIRAAGLFSLQTYVWFAIGVSSLWWISSLTLMLVPPRTVYNR